MIERWLEAIPRPILIVGGLLLGLFYIIVFVQPPRSVCDTQFDLIKQNLTPAVYLDPTKPYTRKGNIFVALKECRSTNTPGGCLDLFDAIRKVLKETAVETNECAPTLAKDETLQKALVASRDLIVELAWGTHPPEPLNKYSWLDLEHVDVFCRMIRLMRNVYGEDEWAEYAHAKLVSLPGGSTLPSGEAWKRSIMSSCGR